MTNRVNCLPQDFQKMCKQAERDQESRKLEVLMERVKRQIAERENDGFKPGAPKHPGSELESKFGRRLPSRSAPFER